LKKRKKEKKHKLHISESFKGGQKKRPAVKKRHIKRSTVIKLLNPETNGQIGRGGLTGKGKGKKV